MRGHNICFHCKIRKTIFKLSSLPPLIWSSDNISVSDDTLARLRSEDPISKAGNHVVLMIGFTEISCQYSDKTCKKMNYISTNIYLIIMQ